MKNVWTAVVAMLVIAAALSTSSLSARQQGSGQFEYLQLAPVSRYVDSGANRVTHVIGYRACIAEDADWSCRSFERTVIPPPAGVQWPNPANEALGEALARLGREGWDLVSAVDDTPDREAGMVYVFKRPS